MNLEIPWWFFDQDILWVMTALALMIIVIDIENIGYIVKNDIDTYKELF